MITGYKPITNYWARFTQAELQDTESKAVKAVKALLKEVLPEAKADYKKYTELVMVLNHKCWDHSELHQNIIGMWYQEEYLKKHDWALSRLKGEEFNYYYSTLD